MTGDGTGADKGKGSRDDWGEIVRFCKDSGRRAYLVEKDVKMLFMLCNRIEGEERCVELGKGVLLSTSHKSTPSRPAIDTAKFFFLT